MLNSQVGECQAVLVFECSDEVMTDRMIRRGRPGDNEDTIRRERLKSHATETVPVIKYYREKLGNKVYTVSCCTVNLGFISSPPPLFCRYMLRKKKMKYMLK